MYTILSELHIIQARPFPDGMHQYNVHYLCFVLADIPHAICIVMYNCYHTLTCSVGGSELHNIIITFCGNYVHNIMKYAVKASNVT